MVICDVKKRVWDGAWKTWKHSGREYDDAEHRLEARRVYFWKRRKVNWKAGEVLRLCTCPLNVWTLYSIASIPSPLKSLSINFFLVSLICLTFYRLWNQFVDLWGLFFTFMKVLLLHNFLSLGYGGQRRSKISQTKEDFFSFFFNLLNIPLRHGH